MKKILSTLALSSLVLLTTGCSDFLEEENHSNVMQDFMATPSGFSMALNSVYANVRSTYSAEEGIHGLMNPGTDELKNNIGGSNRCADLANYDLEKYNANNEYPRKLWNDAYIHINTLNYMIENAAKVDVTTTALTAAQRDQYLGEAYFMRAYNYFHLVEQFGDVTLTTTYNASPSTSSERHDMVRVYEEVIIPDLLNAIRLCSPSPQLNNLESGRASAATARHLLSRVYLTLAWVFDKDPANPSYKGNTQTKYYNTTKAKEYYQKAFDMATGLIADASSLGLKLMDNFADIFDEANDAPSGKNKEELFVARMDWDDDNTFGGRSTLNHYFVNGYDQYLGERNIMTDVVTLGLILPAIPIMLSTIVIKIHVIKQLSRQYGMPLKRKKAVLSIMSLTARTKASTGTIPLLVILPCTIRDIICLLKKSELKLKTVKVITI